MGKNTAIGWCDDTVNLWWGCNEVAPECDFCYAKFRAKWVGKGRAWEDVRFAVPSAFKTLDRLQALAEKAGTVRTVFVQSMGDIFEKPMPLVDWKGNDLGITTERLRRDFVRSIGKWRNLVFLMLTKRPGLIRDLVHPDWLTEGWPDNVWTGTSVGSEKSLKQIERLAHAPGKHFVSFEPLLEDIGGISKFWKFDHCPEDSGADGCEGCPGYGMECNAALDPCIHWAIVGCESRGQRVGRVPENWNDFAAALVEQLRSADVPTYVKQVPIDGLVSTEPNPQWDSRLVYREFPQWLPERVHA